MAKSKKDFNELETGMIAFARSIQITEGLFYGTSSDDDTVRRPIPVLEKGVRGQTSQDNAAADKAGKSNPQSVEVAVVPQECDGVSLEFGVRVLPAAMKPHSCGDHTKSLAYQEIAGMYRDAGGFNELALLYVWNIANARFAWRNRFQTDHSEVRVKLPTGATITFDPSKLSLDKPATAEGLAGAVIGDGFALFTLLDGVANGLSNSPFQFDVVWHAEFKPGQEIFPSQEYVRDENKRDKSDLSRVYAKLPTRFEGKEVLQASMHSQKIGAAIRHIDIWHDDAIYGAIAVNPYGGVQETSAVLRGPSSKKSFYDIRRDSTAIRENLKDASDAKMISGDVHFFIANLVRGGVFGAAGAE